MYSFLRNGQHCFCHMSLASKLFHVETYIFNVVIAIIIYNVIYIKPMDLVQNLNNTINIDSSIFRQSYHLEIAKGSNYQR